MDIKKLAESLHPYERRVLPVLAENQYLSDLCAATGLKEVEVMRALQWLQGKKAVVVETAPKEVIVLDKNGALYIKDGLPERRFLEIIKDRELPLNKIGEKAKLSTEEVNICIGLLRQKSAVIILKDKELKVKITDQGKRLLSSEFLEEKFLKKKFPREMSSLSAEERHVLEQLKKRKQIIRVDVEKIKKATLTDIGKKLVSMGIRDTNVIDTITSQILQSGGWKGKSFRRYDVSLDVPRIFGGKKQPYRTFLDMVRQKFVAMGFTECAGPVVEQEFWNMDALFMPQFHSARDIHDAYFIKSPTHTKIESKLIKRVKAAHESGGGTGSTGWRYSFDEQRTQRNVLRSHDTAVSPRTLVSPNLNVPGKYFQITRCFRHDVIDATHLPDFDQVGGFVIEEGLNLRHLFGLLRMFAKEFAGIEEVRLVPGYFPFTEPSVELYAKHPKLGWLELAGAGIFRPEMVKPLIGKDMTVIAWGVGISRLAMFALGINDVRQLFSHDLAFLRDGPVI